MFDWNKYKETLQTKKELLEEILQIFQKYEVTDPRAKAVITGLLESIYFMEGALCDDNK